MKFQYHGTASGEVEVLHAEGQCFYFKFQNIASISVSYD